MCWLGRLLALQRAVLVSLCTPCPTIGCAPLSNLRVAGTVLLIMPATAVLPCWCCVACSGVVPYVSAWPVGRAALGLGPWSTVSDCASGMLVVHPYQNNVVITCSLGTYTRELFVIN